jgi:hypothetical protein
MSRKMEGAEGEAIALGSDAVCSSIAKEKNGDDNIQSAAEAQQQDVVADRQLAFHPAAELFPLMHGEEFDALVADIRATGQRDPVVLHHDGRVLDGRNRVSACQALGIEPHSILWDGKPGEELAYVISRNLHRRHLTTEERAKIAVKLATMKQGERTDLSPNGGRLSQAQAASLMGLSPRSLQRVKAKQNASTVEPTIKKPKANPTPKPKDAPRKAQIEKLMAAVQTILDAPVDLKLSYGVLKIRRAVKRLSALLPSENAAKLKPEDLFSRAEEAATAMDCQTQRAFLEKQAKMLGLELRAVGGSGPGGAP